MGLNIYGIRGFFGLPGSGKTIAMSRELMRLRQLYGDKVYICTNYGFSGEDFPFKSWTQLLKNYDKPLIVAWDEVQNEFNSRDFKNFPIVLLTQLTQVRKGNGIRLYFTSQRWHFVDKNFRSLADDIAECKTLLGCFTVIKHYSVDDYEEMLNCKAVDLKMKIKPSNVDYFVHSDVLRNSYDSYAMLETAKSKDYMDRAELSAINSNE